jgi:hypothetical protein
VPLPAIVAGIDDARETVAAETGLIRDVRATARLSNTLSGQSASVYLGVAPNCRPVDTPQVTVYAPVAMPQNVLFAACRFLLATLAVRGATSPRWSSRIAAIIHG